MQFEEEKREHEIKGRVERTSETIKMRRIIKKGRRKKIQEQKKKQSEQRHIICRTYMQEKRECAIPMEGEEEDAILWNTI